MILVSHLFAHSLNVQQFFLTHRTLSGATTLGQSRPASNGNKGVLHILQSSSQCILLPQLIELQQFYIQIIHLDSV